MKKVITQRDDIAFYIKMLPLAQLHPEAYDKSKTIMCADTNEQSLKLLEDVYAKKTIAKPTCDTDVVDVSLALAERLGISGTPAIIFENGKMVGGAIGAEDIIKIIDDI